MQLPSTNSIPTTSSSVLHPLYWSKTSITSSYPPTSSHVRDPSPYADRDECTGGLHQINRSGQTAWYFTLDVREKKKRGLDWGRLSGQKRTKRDGNGVAAAHGVQAMSAQGPRRIRSTCISAGGFLCHFFPWLPAMALQRGPSGCPKGTGVFYWFGNEFPLFYHGRRWISFVTGTSFLFRLIFLCALVTVIAI